MPGEDTPAVRRVLGDNRFFPVRLETLGDGHLDLDIFLRYPTSIEPALYRSAGLEFTPDDRQRLRESGVEFVYVPMQQHRIYRRLLSRRLDAAFRDDKVNRQARAKIVRDECRRIIEDVMISPGQAEAVESVAEISRQFARWSRDDAEGFSYLLDMSAHDFYTATHMVNVGVGCGLLARELRPGDDEFARVLVQGGFLHDTGKRGIPEAILNKEGRLDPSEWDLIRSHPLKGYDELARHARLPREVPEMARDHHERLDGKGYPAGKRGRSIGLPARVCTVVDVFDAITASRPYRGPTPAHEALRVLAEGTGTHFDPPVVEAWAGLVRRLIAADPSRQPPLGAVTASPLSLDAITPSVWSDPAGRANARAYRFEPGERRRFPRRGCLTVVSAVFLRQGKPMPVALGEEFWIEVADIGQSGALLLAPWPLSLNDVLLLTLVQHGAGPLRRHARVVRVRSPGDDRWLAGVRFIAEEKQARGRAAG